MPTSTASALGEVRRMIPPMLASFHKGQLGKVAVIGGSQDYTGAPYFSATASACLGCDMSHVICTPEAGSVIKSYSPNLMVHPLMRESLTTDPRSGKVNADADAIANNIADIFSKFHVLVIGPGLGQDDLMLATVTRVLQMARERNVPVVLDADALLVVQKHFRLIRGYKQAILTPNAMEFKQLCKAANVEVGNNNDETGTVERLARELGGVTVLRKGAEDVISNGEITLINTGEGGKKRSGGQGDTLTGSTATFLAWRKAYTDRLWEDSADGRLTEEHMIVLAAFGGSTITRECSRLAFVKKGRSLQASDLAEEVHNAFLTFFAEVDCNGGGGPADR